MAAREIGRHYAHPVGPIRCRVYLRLLCNPALSLPPVRARCSLGEDDACLGASADAACLYRWHNFARRGRWPDDSPQWPHRRGHCGHSTSATHDLLLRSDPPIGDPLSTRGGRCQLCGRYLPVRSNSLVGGFRRGLTVPPLRLICLLTDEAELS